MGSLRKKQVARIDNPYVQQQEKHVQSTGRKTRGLVRRLTLYAVITAIVLILAVSTLISQADALNKKNEEKQEAEKKMAALQKEETLLLEEIVKLKDDDYIAKLARKEYFLSEKGEIIFTLPKKEEDSD